MATDKLFFSIFQSRPDLILSWLDDRPADAAGYRFTAPVLKAREYRLDGLFLPPPDRGDLPAVILEAQMAPDPGFLLRLYAETARFLQQEAWGGDWRVMVICPSRTLNFGATTPIQEFIERRLHWIELLDPEAEADNPLTQALSLLVKPPNTWLALVDRLRQEADANPEAAALLPWIPTILAAGNSSLSIQQICAMAGITVEDFRNSHLYQEILGIGLAEGEARGAARGEAAVTIRQLNRRCGPLSDATIARIQALPLDQLENLAEALLDFNGAGDLEAWLSKSV